MPQDHSVLFRGPGVERHVFLDVLERRWDPFAGLIEVLKRRGGTGEIIRITPSQQEQDLIRQTEYAGGRSSRLWRYRKLLPAMRGRVVDALRSAKEAPAVLYTADEGVWGELAGSIIREFGGRVRGVNFQHGLLLPVKARYLRLRRTLNRVTEGVVGFPVIGCGFGGSRSDTYLVYSEAEQAFLREAGREAVAFPRLIKRDLIMAARTEDGPLGRALMALPACVPGSEIRCSLEDFIRKMAPLLTAVSDRTGQPVLLRPHPGRGGDIAARMVEELGLGPNIEFDASADGAHVAGQASWVLSAHSTVLFEAALLGLVPIAVRSSCFEDLLPFEHEVVDVRLPLRDQLEKTMSEETRSEYADRVSNEWAFEGEVNQIVDEWVQLEGAGGPR